LGFGFFFGSSFLILIRDWRFLHWLSSHPPGGDSVDYLV
jgi:hypothetical protein